MTLNSNPQCPGVKRKGLLFPIVARDPCRTCKACDLCCMPPLYARCNGLLGDATLFLFSDSSVNSHSDSLFTLPLQDKLEFFKFVLLNLLIYLYIIYYSFYYTKY